MTSGLETYDSRIIISSEALKSLSFAFKWSMSGTPKRGACYLNNLRTSPRFVILSGEKRRMLKNGLSEI